MENKTQIKNETAISSNGVLTAVRPEVAWFAIKMEEKLAENDHKGGWQDESFDYLFDRIKGETKELRKAYFDGDTTNEDVMNEAIDIANFAMMIADNHR